MPEQATAARFTFPAGALIHIDGVPVKLLGDLEAESVHSANDERLAKVTSEHRGNVHGFTPPGRAANAGAEQLAEVNKKLDAVLAGLATAGAAPGKAPAAKSGKAE